MTTTITEKGVEVLKEEMEKNTVVRECSDCGFEVRAAPDETEITCADHTWYEI